MKRIFGISLVMIFISACDNSGSPADLETRKAIWIDKGQDAVRAKLKDGASAEFRNVFFSDSSGTPLTCGEVNGKNSFGAYNGFQHFVSGGSIENTFLETEVSGFEDVWNKMCNR